MKFEIRKIAEIIGGEIQGNSEITISHAAKIEEASSGSITFLANPKYEPYVYTTKASAIIVEKNFKPEKKISSTLILVDDPYLSFTTLLETYDKQTSSSKSGIEKPSYMGENTQIGENMYQGAFSYIGNNVTIGNNVKIYPHTYIGDHVVIGNNTILHAGVKIYNNCIIGANCTIHAGAVIGSDGFGFAPQQDGTYKKIPQIGNVIIKNNVEIGANTTIDRATMNSTIIHKGVKLDNLIQIAHNVEIGENTVIASQSGVSGSSKIGKNCVIAGQVGVVGHIEIKDNVTLAAQSGVTKSNKHAGDVLLGSPAFDRKKYLKCYSVFKNLPELSQKVRNLEEKILTLPPENL